jgi:hypothetical protein
MNEAPTTINPQSASLLLSILQSKAGDRWERALEELRGKRLQVEGEFPRFVVTNKSGIRYNVSLDGQGNGTCTCPDFQVRTSHEGRLCKHVSAAAIASLIPLISSPKSDPVPGNREPQQPVPVAGRAPLAFRLRKKLQGESKDGVVIEVEGTSTGDEAEDEQTIAAANRLLSQAAASIPAKVEASTEAPAHAGCSRATVKAAPVKATNPAVENQPIPAVISKIDRMKTRRGESFFLAVAVGDETVRVFGSPEELAERLEESGYDIPAHEIQAGVELNLPCLVVLATGGNGYRTIQKFLPETV